MLRAFGIVFLATFATALANGSTCTEDEHFSVAYCLGEFAGGLEVKKGEWDNLRFVGLEPRRRQKRPEVVDFEWERCPLLEDILQRCGVTFGQTSAFVVSSFQGIGIHFNDWRNVVKADSVLKAMNDGGEGEVTCNEFLFSSLAEFELDENGCVSLPYCIWLPYNHPCFRHKTEGIEEVLDGWYRATELEKFLQKAFAVQFSRGAFVAFQPDRPWIIHRNTIEEHLKADCFLHTEIPESGLCGGGLGYLFQPMSSMLPDNIIYLCYSNILADKQNVNYFCQGVECIGDAEKVLQISGARFGTNSHLACDSEGRRIMCPSTITDARKTAFLLTRLFPYLGYQGTDHWMSRDRPLASDNEEEVDSP